MKKWSRLSVVLLSAMIAFTACGINKTKASDIAATRGLNRRIVMGYSQIGSESDWRIACTNSVKKAAAEYNIELLFLDAQQKQENQLAAIRSFIQRKVDIIAFTPVVSSGWEAVLQECKAAGIPTICVDRTIDGPDSLFNCFIGSDFKQEGTRAARWLVGYMNKAGRGNEKISIVEIQGTAGSAAATDRDSGFREVLKDNPNYRIIKSNCGDFTRAGGKQVMQDFLKDHGTAVDVVFAHNDDMALGAIEAIEAHGLKPGVDIIVVSVDAVKRAFEAIMEGKLNCTIECNPLLGPQVMNTAVRILDGRPVDKWVTSNESLFDRSNASAAYSGRQY